MKITSAAALTGAGIAVLFFGVQHAFGWIAGAGWNLLNIAVLARLGDLLMQSSPDRRRKVSWLLITKFGLLYPAGITLLWSGIAPAVSFALGFTAVLILMTISFLMVKPVEVAHD